MVEPTDAYPKGLSRVPFAETDDNNSHGSVLWMLAAIAAMGLGVGLVLCLIGWAVLAFWIQ